MYNKETPEPTIQKLELKNWKDFMVGTFKKSDSSIEDSIGNTVDRLVRISPKIKKSSKVLFFSGGNTFVPIYLASKFGCKMTIVTESKEAGDELTKQIKKHEVDEKVEVLVDDYTLTSFSHESFDMIWSVGALTKREQLLLVMKEAKRLLVPQGRVILCELSKSEELEDATVSPFTTHSIEEIMDFANKADLEKVYEKPLHTETIAHYKYLVEAVEKAGDAAKKALGEKEYAVAISTLKLMSHKAENNELAWSFLQFQKRNA